MASRWVLPLLVIVILVNACTPVSRRTGTFQTKTPGYAYLDGVVAKEGKPIYRVEQKDIDPFTTAYTIRSTDGHEEGTVTFASSYGGLLQCRASFPSLGTHYEARIPVVPFTDLLASYIDNGVLAEGHVNATGLKSYAASRGISLVDTRAQIQRLSEAAKRHECARCDEDFRRCQVEASSRRGHPAPGVTFVESCQRQYQACSQGGILTRDNEWPCGPAPR